MADVEVHDWLSDFVKWLGLGGLALGWHAARKTGELVNRLESVEGRGNPVTVVAEHGVRIVALEKGLENHVERLDGIASCVARLEGLEQAAQADRHEILRLLRGHVARGGE